MYFHIWALPMFYVCARVEPEHFEGAGINYDASNFPEILKTNLKFIYYRLLDYILTQIVYPHPDRCFCMVARIDWPGYISDF